ncbi:MAG: iron-containing alcohol dehydrogenase [Halioglobus sp.]
METLNEFAHLHTSWNYPTAISVGPDSVKQLSNLCAQYGIKNPLLVTDPGIAALDTTKDITASLSGSDTGSLGLGIFSEVKSNPTGENVSAGAEVYNRGAHDGIIALGGGSALDAGKAIAMVAGQTGSLFDYADEDGASPIEGAAVAPVIAIPTTAGTGSEVGRASVITDSVQQRKRILFHPRMLPVQVILDPILTLGLPKHLTAATGMDALSHNLEALCANGFHPMAKGIALEGIALVQEYLPRAVTDGNDIEARTNMLVASSMGATAFQRGLGAMHALSHPLGALYDAHHGLLNAIVMPYVLIANKPAITQTLADAARALGLPQHTFQGFLDWILALRAQLDIPHSLQDIGIDASDAKRVGEMAAADSTAAGNPIAFKPGEYSALFERAVLGDISQR